MTLFEFTTEKSVQNWYSQDDTVMGGVSSSEMLFIQGGSALFTGLLSLENNGGFAQVKYSKTEFDLSNYDGLELRLKGAKVRNYQLRLQTDTPQISYRQDFVAQADWELIRLPFSGFEPVFRGRNVLGAPELNTRVIRSVGFMLASKDEGKFELNIDYLKAYAD